VRGPRSGADGGREVRAGEGGAGGDEAGGGALESELALNSPGFTPLAFANASMVCVLVTRERLVPTDDLA
jgi:hypothetical protein